MKVTELFRQRRRYDRQTMLRIAGGKTVQGAMHLLSYLYLIGISFVILYPILYMLSMAFRPSEQVNDLNVVWIPTRLTLDNIVGVWKNFHYGTLLKNSASLSLGCALLSVVSCCMIGYGFARFRFPGKTPLLVLLVLTMILPMEVVSIPNFLMFSDFDPLGLVSLVRAVTGLQIRINIFDNPLNCYLPAAMGVGLKNGLYILIFMQFFKGLPKEIEEAAYVDGCGFFKTMLRVMLPNAKPAVLVVLLFAVVWYWNDTSLTSLYFDQFMTVSGELLRRSTDAGARLNATVATDIVTWVQAGVMLSVFPMILLYLFCQKSFVESIASTGLVG